MDANGNSQSIFKFQGADVTQFDTFGLPNMTVYQIENNRRSTSQIIKLLKVQL